MREKRVVQASCFLSDSTSLRDVPEDFFLQPAGPAESQSTSFRTFPETIGSRFLLQPLNPFLYPTKNLFLEQAGVLHG